MKLSKNHKIIIAVLLFILVVYFFYRRKKQNNSTVATTDTGSAFNIQVAEPVANDNFPLKIGSKGDNVKRLQNALNTINASHPFNSQYTPLVADGALGQKTYEAVLVLIGTSAWSMNGLTQDKWNLIVSRANNLASYK